MEYSYVGQASRGRRLRNAAALIAGLSALGFVGVAHAEPDGCVVDGSTATCEGDQSNGLTGGNEFPTATTTVIINNLDGPITPQDGKAGLFFIADSIATIDAHADVTTTGGGDGYFLQAPGPIDFTSKGDITSNGQRGIFANSTLSDVTVRSKGDIWALQEAIFAKGVGPVVIDSHGDIFSDALKGLYGESSQSTVTIDSKGDVDTDDESIFAQAFGDVTVRSKGALTSDTLKAIFANSLDANAFVRSIGNIHADDEAIFAQGPGNVDVFSEGNLTSTTLRGIFANAHIPGGHFGTATVESHGSIDAYEEAIFAQGPNDVSVLSYGDLISRNFRGIFANSQFETAYVKSEGNISAEEEAIFAQGPQGVEVDSTGNLTSTEFRGLFASSGSGPITIGSKGNITAFRDALFANGHGNVVVNSVGDLHSTSTGTGSRALFASSSHGMVTVDSKGDLESDAEALFAEGATGVHVMSRGDLTSHDSRGLFAEAVSGIAFADSKGDISAYLDGLHVRGVTSATVYNDGDVTSATARGMLVQSTGGPVSLYSMGDIRSNSSTFLEGLFARSLGNLTVDSWGDIHSESFRGAFLESTDGAVDVGIWGNVTAEFEGVFVSGPDNVTVKINGDVTSNEWRGILVSRALSGGGPGMIDLTYGGGTVQSLGGDPIKQPHAIEVDANGGSSLVTILADGTVIGGSNFSTGPNFSYGVLFRSGSNNLVNWGEINEDNGGRALGGIDDGDDTIDNYKLIVGSSFLGGGVNTFNNHEWGLYESGATIDLGSGDDFNNEGWLSPFGLDFIGTSNLIGDFRQTTGYLLVDVDFADGSHDVLEVPSGTGTVEAGGLVGAYVINLGTATSWSGLTVIDNTGGAVVDNGIAGADQGPLQVTVVPIATTIDTVDINVAIDLGFAALEGNQATLGDFFQDQFEDLVAGGLTPDQENFFLGLINVGDTSAYQNALDQLSPGYANAAIEAVFAAVGGFAGNFFTCSVRDGDYRFLAQNSCAWAVGGGRVYDRDGSSGDLDVEDRAANVAGGAQFTRDAWSFGFGAGYEHGETEAGSTDLDRDQFNVGLVGKRRWDAFELAAAITGGGGNIDSEREITIPRIAATAEGSRDFFYVAGTGRATYIHEMGGVYLKPMVEGAVTFVSADAYTETGGGVPNLSVEESEEVVGRGSAMLEIGTEFGSAEGVLVRPFVGGGVSVLAGSETEATASFPGLSTDTVTLTSDVDDFYGDVKAGVQVLGARGWTGRLQYDGHFSENTQQHGGSAKLSIPF